MEQATNGSVRGSPRRLRETLAAAAVAAPRGGGAWVVGVNAAVVMAYHLFVGLSVNVLMARYDEIIFRGEQESITPSYWELSYVLNAARARQEHEKRLVNSSIASMNHPISKSTEMTAKSSISSSSPDYDIIYVWSVNPENLFDKTPYKQFCRWRQGDKSQRQRVARIEGWNMTRYRHVVTPNATSLLKIQFHCMDTMRKSPLGAGNWVQIIYLLRLAATGVPLLDVELSCIDNHDDDAHLNQHPPTIQSTLILPWLMGHYSSEQTRQLLYKYWNNHTLADHQCLTTQWGDAPVGWMLPFIRYELRRMAVALVGLPKKDPTHPAHWWVQEQQRHILSSKQSSADKRLAEQYHPSSVYYRGDSPPLLNPFDPSYQPLLENIELDDIVIHFRCGDIMAAKQYFFRFLKFKEFATRMDPAAESIGIVTQPFFGGNTTNMDEQARLKDYKDAFRSTICRRLVLGFVDYLEKVFPKARIRIHNSKQETIALAYARLIMAKLQAFSYPDSSFSVYPVLATFGTGWHMYPTKSPYYKYPPKTKWLKDIIIIDDDSGKMEFMHIDKHDALYAVETYEMRQQGPDDDQVMTTIVQWFVNDSFVLPRMTLK